MHYDEVFIFAHHTDKNKQIVLEGEMCEKDFGGREVCETDLGEREMLETDLGERSVGERPWGERRM